CLPASVDVNGDGVSAVTEEEGDCMVFSGITCFQLENRLGMTTIERKRKFNQRNSQPRRIGLFLRCLHCPG
ncbi:hypothetical protein, partial [Endozoicomonas acroporae]|uniref:hypothetical protein n=1 Tax=Endozoicomonas acroporae TaxID=1701104 RepID=UPI003D79B7AC